MVHFFNEDVSYVLKDKMKLKNWVKIMIEQHQKSLGEVNFVFCSDEYLHEMNVEYLQHDTLTDIITFDYCDGNTVSGDLFISVDRVKDNASDLKIKLTDELHRVMIHGVLHLIGFKDKSQQDAATMRSQEEKSLILRGF
ncbi:MAG: rRNA maturation RNase YbeY [Flavobacteriales bacterium]|nr:rRNA maturation RNase YbeY [Flavobacteriales bacterium]